MKPGIKRSLKLLLKIAVTAAALYYVFSRVDLKKMAEAYSGLSFPPLAAAFALFVFSKLAAAVRLNAFLKAAGVLLSEKTNLRLYLLGMFYNVFLPGGVGGDGYKIYLLKKKSGLAAGRIFAAVLADRLSGLLALFMLSVAAFYFLDYALSLRLYAWTLLPLSYAIFHLTVRRFWGFLSDALFKTSLLSFVVQISQLISAWFLMLSLNISGREAEYLWIFMVSSIVAALPITIGGAGAREAAFLFGSRIFGLDANLSISLSLLFYFITLLVSLSGAAFVFRPPLDGAGCRLSGKNPDGETVEAP